MMETDILADHKINILFLKTCFDLTRPKWLFCEKTAIILLKNNFYFLKTQHYEDKSITFGLQNHSF